MLLSRGVATNFRRGGDGTCLGGRIQVSQNHLPPNSDFSSDFAQFILEILENPKLLAKIRFFLNRDFWGEGHHSQNFEPGGHVPRNPPPPGGAAHASKPP